MIKLLSMAVLTLALTGCYKYGNTTDDFKLPEGLKDCRVYYVEGKLTNLTIVRCPLSNTAVNYKSGKTSKSISVVEM